MKSLIRKVEVTEGKDTKTCLCIGCVPTRTLAHDVYVADLQSSQEKLVEWDHAVNNGEKVSIYLVFVRGYIGALI